MKSNRIKFSAIFCVLLACASFASVAAVAEVAEVDKVYGSNEVEVARNSEPSGAAIYQCFMGNAMANEKSFMALVDKEKHVLAVTPFKPDQTLPSVAQHMVNTSADAPIFLEPSKPVRVGYEVRIDGSNNARLQVGKGSLKCFPSFDE